MVSTERTERSWAPLRAVSIAFLLTASSGCASIGTQPAPTAADEWQRLLLERSPLSSQERTRHANAILRANRWERVEELHQRTLEAGWRVALRASPQRIRSAVSRIYQSVRHFARADTGDPIALGWLAPGIDSSTDPAARALYDRLRKRERRQLAERRREQAKKALDEERFTLARSLLERSVALDPDPEEVSVLLDELEQGEQRQQALEPQLTLRDWDASLALPLLAGDMRALREREPTHPEIAFVQAAASLLQGEPETARVRLAELAERDDVLGDVAGRWLERPEVDVEGDLERAVRSYRTKQLLGWIGGSSLAERGTALSPTGFRAWSHAFTLANMGISLPARVLRGWTPDPTRVREAAMRYLDQKPNGRRAGTATAWLDQVGWPEPDALGFQGEFQLPEVKASFDRLGERPVIVSRRVLHSGLLSGSAALFSALESGEAVRLEVRPVRLPVRLDDDLASEGFALTPRTARRLLDELAFGIERDELRWTRQSRDEALEQLRKLDAALARGWVLFAEAWSPPDLDFWSSLTDTAIEGTEHRGRVGIDRGEDSLLVVHEIASEVVGCPRDALCIDRDGTVRTTLYGYLDFSSGAGIGFQSSSLLFGTGIGITDSGPELALVLPIARWLRIDGWLPLEAEVSFHEGAPYVGPVLRKKKCSEAQESPDEASLSRQLPLGLRSRCALRLY